MVKLMAEKELVICDECGSLFFKGRSKKDIQKIVFIESEYVPKLWIFYHRIKINTENNSYIISSKDYRNFWEILENIGEKLPKRRITSYRKNSC